jgi:two-component system, OmpR family, sensor kinase
VKVRTRLVLGFTYILLTVILALTIPLALNLRGRAKDEVTSSALQSAQNIAISVGQQIPQTGAAPASLARLIRNFSDQLSGRVIVTNVSGDVLVDEGGAYLGEPTSAVGENYLTDSRKEMVSALRQRRPYAEVRFSNTLGREIMVAAAPVIDGGALRGAVRISTDIGQVTDSVRRVTIGVIVIGAAGLLSGLIIAFVLAGSLARPLSTLANTARRLGAGDLASRAGKVEGARELRDLATSFDDMAGRLEHTVQAQREFIANASHQLRTPLTGMKLRIEAARAGATDEAMGHQLDAADREVDRLAEIVDRLLTMAREIEEGQPSHVDLGDLASRAVDRWRERAERAKTTLEASGPGAFAQGNPADLDQVLDNLIDNAISYAPGSIRVHTDTAQALASLSVVDAGPGIPKEEQARVTDRFYRGKGTPTGGSGLGLAIARQLVEKWGGSLVVADAEGGGTRIEIRLRQASQDRSKEQERT